MSMDPVDIGEVEAIKLVEEAVLESFGHRKL